MTPGIRDKALDELAQARRICSNLRELAPAGTPLWEAIIAADAALIDAEALRAAEITPTRTIRPYLIGATR